ncbi:MAG: 50S ribosomal protein L17 [Bradymonadaceae bacterium]
MRHRKKGNKLNRGSEHREAMLRNLLKSLVEYELVQTTDARAKELRRFADRLITLGKKQTQHARRQAQAKLEDGDLVAKVFDDLVQRDPIERRDGGYVRLIKVGNRKGDNAAITRVSWVGSNLQNTEEMRFPDHILELIETEDVVDEEGIDEDEPEA